MATDDLTLLAHAGELTRHDMLWLVRRLKRADARVIALELRLRRIKRHRHHRRKRKVKL